MVINRTLGNYEVLDYTARIIRVLYQGSLLQVLGSLLIGKTTYN
jgi:hypothetical protein